MKTNTIFKLSAIATLLLAGAVNAAENQTSTATVTIQNAFDLAEVSALTFGNIRATQTITPGVDGNGTGGSLIPTQTNGAGIRIKSDGTAAELVAQSTVTQGAATADADPSDTAGEISSVVSAIVAGAPGEYNITNAAPFTNLRIEDPADTTELTSPAVPSDSKFDLDIDYDDMTIVGGGNDGDTINGTNLLTDASGAVSFRVGGELTIDPLASAVSDGAYSGTYIITVSY